MRPLYMSFLLSIPACLRTSVHANEHCQQRNPHPGTGMESKPPQLTTLARTLRYTWISIAKLEHELQVGSKLTTAGNDEVTCSSSTAPWGSYGAHHSLERHVRSQGPAGHASPSFINEQRETRATGNRAIRRARRPRRRHHAAAPTTRAVCGETPPFGPREPVR